jgi:hypothetical protein
MYLYTNNFLTPAEVYYLKGQICSQPYYFRPSINAAKDGIVGLTGNNYSDRGILVNEPLDDKILNYIIEKFAAKNNITVHKILRGRANLTCKTNDPKPMEPHVDLRRVVKNYNLVYYVNDADGATNLYRQKYTGEHVDGDSLELYKSFTPKEGYALFFDGDIFHNWEYPNEADFRFSVVINLVCDVDESRLESVDF